MGVYKNGVDISTPNKPVKKENKLDLFKSKVIGFIENCDVPDEVDELKDDEYSEATIIKEFTVLYMQFVGDGSSTYKVMILQDKETGTRHYNEIDVYDYDTTDEADLKLIDILTLLEGDSVEMVFENPEDGIDFDNLVEVTRLSIPTE